MPYRALGRGNSSSRCFFSHTASWWWVGQVRGCVSVCGGGRSRRRLASEMSDLRLSWSTTPIATDVAPIVLRNDEWDLGVEFAVTPLLAKLEFDDPPVPTPHPGRTTGEPGEPPSMPEVARPGPVPRRCRWCLRRKCTHCQCAGHFGCGHRVGRPCAASRYRRRRVCNRCYRTSRRARPQSANVNVKPCK